MSEMKKDCFAFCKKKGKNVCNVLEDLSCEDCRFYKNRNEIKNNPYYAFSYKDKLKHKEDVKKMNIKKEAIVWE